MALTDAQIKVVIAAELKKAGFDKASRQVSALERGFKRLGGTILTVFSVRAITQFGKASVQAFANAEREAAQLRTQLKALNLEFASPLLNQYVDALELATGRAGSDLTNAFVSLSAATQDVTTAQSLLNTAMDISAATGKDLQTVSVALQRAYKGEVTALARLRIGLTTAELKGKDFDDVLGQLRDRFTGAQAAAADTYAGKIARLGQATDQAREKVGVGFVKGLQDAGVSVVEFQQQLIKLGETTGKVTGTFAAFGASVSGVFDGLQNNRGLQFLMSSVDFISRSMGFIATGQLQPSFRSTDERRARISEAKRISAIRDQVRAQNNLYKVEQKNIKARTTLEKKAQRESQALKRAGTVFDMENIQIVAAMQGKVTDEQRLRLVALLALNTGNAKAAEEASRAVLALNAASLATLGITIKAGDSVDTVITKLLAAQAKIALVGLGISNIPKAPNPFEDWDGIIQNVLNNLAKVQAAIIPGVAAVKPLSVTPATTPQTVTSGFGLSKTFPTMATASAGEFDPNFDTAEFFESLGLNRVGDSYTINVNVQGSIMAENDIADVITDQLYKAQRNGKNILVRSVAL